MCLDRAYPLPVLSLFNLRGFQPLNISKGHSGAIPDNPYTRAAIVAAKVTPEMRKALRKFAAEKDATVSAVIVAAIERYLAQHRECAA